VAAVLGAAGAQAQQPREPQHYHPGGRPPEHVDARYAHGRYYPNHGVYVGAVPPHAVAFERPGGRYYYAGGVWYAPYGPHYVVVPAPVGVFVPVLPAFCTTLWFGGVPYYYANDTYYQWSQAQGGYEVVTPPSDQDATTDAPAPPPPQGDNLFIYPQGGQSAEQQATDQYECHQWSSSQTGFDPTQSGGGVPPEQLAARRADYHRAMIACLQGRGYSAR
jgi:hypothetical protein